MAECGCYRGWMTILALCAGIGIAEAQQSQTSPAEDQAVPDVTAATAPPPVAVVAIPDDAQLESGGVRIGNIDIKVVDVFDPENPKESGALYRAANYLHINTREQTVRPQLLFKPGQVYSRHVLDETERNLRARRYLEDASIVPVKYHPETNTVDLLVRVHDVWTLNPGASFGRSGGVNRSGVQIDESNLLGWGKGVSVDRTREVDRSAWRVAYVDSNLLSSRWELRTAYSNTSDGDSSNLFIEHPFYSLNTRWSGAFDASRLERMDRRFEQSVAVDQYITRQRSAGVQGGWSTGIRHRDGQVPWVQRWLLGYRDEQQQYLPDPVLGTIQLPADRLLRYPWLGVSWFQDQYEVTRNRDQIARTEDLYIGRSLYLSIGYAARSWGSDRNAMLLNFTFQDAYRLSERQYLFATLGISGRRQDNQWQGTVFSGSLRYDLRETAKALLTVNLKHAHSEHPDESQQLFLGSDEGMRGYPLRYRSGTQRNVLVIEQRLYTDRQILRLLSVGGAAFVDIGHIGGEANPLPGSGSTFTDVGIGLRLGNIRSSRGDMFHLDMAYPLNAQGVDRKLQFSVTTLHTF